MDSARWRQVQELFHQATGLPPSEQRAFLQKACSGDAALLADVLAMLEEDARGTSLLDRDLGHVAHQVFSEGAAPALPWPNIGPYRLQRVLGEGGMGVVYLAQREDLGSQVAIKLLRDAWLSPARRERFTAEQRTLAQLNHPSIARIYDADSLPDGTPWFAMEYVEGLPLTEYCRQRQSSLRERLELFRAVCEAVQFAHSHAVIHRDLKPSNILVRADGSVRLLDFGIAKQLESLDRPADQTRTGLRLMTPAYAAPEQIRGDRVGMHSDVYSLGIILYELLAGRLPFDLSSRTPGEAESILLSDEPARPSEAARQPAASGARVPAVGRTAWADLDVLCLTAMHRDPQRRYRSVEALIRDVDHFLKGEPLEARPDSLGYRLGKFVCRNRRAVTVTVAVFVAVVSLVAFFTVRLAIARNDALAEAARTQRIQSFMLNLFRGGDEITGPAADLRVVTLVDRGVQQAESLSSEPAIQAELFKTLGEIYQKLGNLEQADILLQRALEQRRAILGEVHPQVAESLAALGLLRVDQAQLEEAERLAREGLEMARQTLPADHPMLAGTASALGRVLEERGEYAQAIPLFEEAVAVYSAPGKPTPELAATLTLLANTHFYAGDFDASEELNLRALVLDTQLYGDRHPSVADDLINLGVIQFQRGRYEEAERYQRDGLEIFESWYGPDHHRTGSALTVLARTLVQQERYDEASQMLRRSLAIQERVYGPTHRFVASTLNELGIVAIVQGNLDEAEASYHRMGEIYREIYNDRHHLIAIALSNLSNVFVERKNYRRAEQLLRESVARFTDTLSAEHMHTATARIKLGRVLALNERYADAEGELLAGVEALNLMSTPPRPWLRRAYTDLIRVYEALNRPEEAEKFREEMDQSEG
jgi:eukaryotic-like serine/threonine-protein kinase